MALSNDEQRRIWAQYRAVFAGGAGYEVLKDMEKAHHIHDTTVRKGANGIDPLAMAFAEGERNVVLRIHAILSSDATDYDGEQNG